MTLSLIAQASAALSLTERDALLALAKALAWIVGTVCSGAVAVIGLLWRWMSNRFKNVEAKAATRDVKLRNEMQALVSPLETKIDMVQGDVRTIREAVIRIDPDVDFTK